MIIDYRLSIISNYYCSATNEHLSGAGAQISSYSLPLIKFLRSILIRGTVYTEEEGLMPGHSRHEASMLHYYSSTSQRRFVRNEHPAAMLLGGVRVRRVLYLHQTSTIF